MTEKEKSAGEDPSHETRVREAFDSFLDGRRQNLDERGHGLLERLREAAASRDREGLREHLTEAKEKHGWLYRELAAHPELANLLDELALWGF